MSTPKHVVARLTIVTAAGNTYVEVRDDSTFYRFYKFFYSKGKSKTRREGEFHKNRNTAKDLEAIRDQLVARIKKLGTPALSTKIVIYRKRLHKKFLTCSPDQLPGKLTCIESIRRSDVPGKVNIPIYGHTFLQKRADLMTKNKPGGAS
jgi:hypothetical protein